MKPADIVGIVVRVIGFVIIVHGLWVVLGGLVTVAETVVQSYRPPEDQYSPLCYLGMGVPEVVLGAICFFWADWIVRLTYREK